MTETTPHPAGLNMQPIQSEAWVRANLSRGLARNLLIESARRSNTKSGIKVAIGGAGRNLRAFERAVVRLRVLPFVVMARSGRSKGMFWMDVIWRTTREMNFKLLARPDEYTTSEVVEYTAGLKRMSRSEKLAFFCVLSVRFHALHRWIERGNGFDPRVDLLERLDAEALWLVPAFQLADRLGPKFCLPDQHGGLWFCEAFSDAADSIDIVIDTYVGPRELRPDQCAYIEAVQKDGLLAANGIKE